MYFSIVCDGTFLFLDSRKAGFEFGHGLAQGAGDAWQAFAEQQQGDQTDNDPFKAAGHTEKSYWQCIHMFLLS